MISPTRQRGLSEANGSWKIHLHPPPAPRGAPPDPRSRRGSTPFDQHLSGARTEGPTAMRASVDLPEPNSPTSPSVSPRQIVKSSPSTAFSQRRGSRSIRRESHGLETSKTLLRPRTTRMGFDSVHRATRGRAAVVEPAGRAAIADRQQRRALDPAAVECARTTRSECAAARDCGKPRHRRRESARADLTRVSNVGIAAISPCA